MIAPNDLRWKVARGPLLTFQEAVKMVSNAKSVLEGLEAIQDAAKAGQVKADPREVGSAINFAMHQMNTLEAHLKRSARGF